MIVGQTTTQQLGRAAQLPDVAAVTQLRGVGKMYSQVMRGQKVMQRVKRNFTVITEPGEKR